MITVRDSLRDSSNGFGFLRLLFATLVLLDHAFPLGGYGQDPMWGWSKGQDTFGGISVSAFFAISGYLITKSAVSSDIIQFLWRRSLRIFPAYWFALLVTAFLLGPVVFFFENSSLTGYFSAGENGPLQYIWKNAFLDIGQYRIYDLLAKTTPYGATVGASVFNGSVWTLIYEWRCYIFIGILAAFAVLRKMPIVLAMITASLYFLMLLQLCLPDKLAAISPLTADVHLLRYSFLFMLGGVIARYSDRIEMDAKIGIFCWAVFIAALFKGGYLFLGYPALVYGLVWLASSMPAALKKVGATNDYSYGVYIYGFPVQQLLAFFHVHQLGLLTYLSATIVITYACAYISWHLIEKRSLKLKSAFLGKGIPYVREIGRRISGSMAADRQLPKENQ
ncbi:acyltransferase family protein [Chitinimonas koreensis]|uniref:acyltransferase family protein n=1 Tax=Chitinimonas koreensis TaxID=356302 RepID=UPI0006849FE6|nr:acyltransferase [Chitinimonas koreensis]QNM96970.1 acyltransferase [Chitinimonas koreensis]